jgi:hypothetical protein
MAVVAPICPKCDSVIENQSDGSTVEVDIAHQGETVRQAMQKLDRTLASVRLGTAKWLRVIVGSGLIREEAFARLTSAEFRGDVQRVEMPASNRGQIMVQIKP